MSGITQRPGMREFAKEFYSSQTWRDCRDSYKRSKRGLCESCLERGIYTAGAQVHHKIHLSPQNINDPNITLSWDNLQLLCAECHKRIHSKNQRFRYDDCGRCVTNFSPENIPLV